MLKQGFRQSIGLGGGDRQSHWDMSIVSAKVLEDKCCLLLKFEKYYFKI